LEKILYLMLPKLAYNNTSTLLSSRCRLHCVVCVSDVILICFYS
jgi:hypothetical protein